MAEKQNAPSISNLINRSTPLIEKATAFAYKAHEGQMRKACGLPAVFHAIETAEIVAGLTDDEHIISAALLHDTVEDAGVTVEQIKELFGERVSELVASETENKRPHMSSEASWQIRKQEAIDDLLATEDVGVKMIFLGDKLSNMRSFAQLKRNEPEDMWRYFNQKDPEMHHWYYRTIADAVREFEASAAWQELDTLIKFVFEEGN